MHKVQANLSGGVGGVGIENSLRIPQLLLNALELFVRQPSPQLRLGPQLQGVGAYGVSRPVLTSESSQSVRECASVRVAVCQREGERARARERKREREEAKNVHWPNLP